MTARECSYCREVQPDPTASECDNCGGPLRRARRPHAGAPSRSGWQRRQPRPRTLWDDES